MSLLAPSSRLVGSRISRKEDPRLLTGQGRYVDDVDIPGEEYSFRTLKHAAATGDLQTLRDHGLAAERVTLEGDPVEALNALTASIEAL